VRLQNVHTALGETCLSLWSCGHEIVAMKGPPRLFVFLDVCRQDVLTEIVCAFVMRPRDVITTRASPHAP
jgi:hypothetical protein